jgi:hypothetical protein
VTPADITVLCGSPTETELACVVAVITALASRPARGRPAHRESRAALSWRTSLSQAPINWNPTSTRS